MSLSECEHRLKTLRSRGIIGKGKSCKNIKRQYSERTDEAHVS